MEGFFNVEQSNTIKGKSFSCASCGLYRQVLSPKMEPYGNFKKQIMIIGEAPGEQEDKKGKPWQGKAGKLLQRTLKRHGIDLFEDCVSLNSINCRPTSKTGANRSPTGFEINCCQHFKLEAIKEYQPHLILLAGNFAVQSLIGYRWKKDLGGIMKWRGWTIPDQDFNTWICPIYHPSYVQRQEGFDEVEVIWNQDIKRTLELIDKPVPDYNEPEKQVEIIEDENEIAKRLKGLAKAAKFAFDIETTGLKPYDTNNHAIHVISFASEREVFSIPLYRMNKIIDPLKVIMKSKQMKIAHNMKFEDKWVRNMLGINVNNWHWDTMLGSHVLDNRLGVTGLKFQAYVQFGTIGYEDEVSKYLKANGSNSINRIEEAMRIPDIRRKMLLYCGLDSLFTLRLAEMQEDKLTWE